MPADTEDDIAIKMMAVITRAEQPDLFAILVKLYEACCPEGRFDAKKPPKVWDDICKMDLAEIFWRFAAQSFGYAKDHRQYHLISRWLAKKIDLANLLAVYPPEALKDAMTFEVVEQRIIRALRDAVMQQNGQDFKPQQALISRRLDGHWPTLFWTPLMQKIAIEQYRALEAAIRLLDMQKQYAGGMSYATAAAMFKAYVDELFAFDQLYRIFNEHADAVEKAGWDVLKALRETVENCYTGWFLETLGLAWGDFLEQNENALLPENWRLPDVCNQYAFFEQFVEPVIKGGPRNRVYVIVSDAMGDKAATEGETFHAVRQAVDDLYVLVSFFHQQPERHPGDRYRGSWVCLP